MRAIGDMNQISEDVFDFMISIPQKSIRSELAKHFSISISMLLLKIFFFSNLDKLFTIKGEPIQQGHIIANFHGHALSAFSLINKSIKIPMSTEKVRGFPEFGKL